ncbi:MAG: mechanosensitive ion channel [Bacteroidales bacterium]|nr:mechanosensitive ion channel [Bacteroidales bacterium]MDY5737255.1 mechanosensitive ion channel [Candidatus Onthomorpha sp.]MCI6416404.1 mechanosensitive ion channel [Bacteroidales bacterium]MCI6645328.1 mechanosensitive ion channel [Bacteroidales bacterium]MCI6963295.1 mechanosensitive ion channel [Bacteroidales bacterium]
MVLNSTNAFTWNDVLGFLKDIVFKFGPKLIIACIILYVGFKVIRFLCKRISILFEKRNLDPSLRPFLMSINSIGLKVLLILTVVGYLGIEMTQFTAIIASAGVAIGLALSGTLQNVAGGVVLLVLRPFRVGDYISAQGYEGTVKSILIFHTTLVTIDNKVVTIPNGALSSGSIINYTQMETRRIDLEFNLAHGIDLDCVSNAIIAIAKQDKRILTEPDVVVIPTISQLAISIDLRFWCKTGDYWDVLADMNKQVYDYLVREKVALPYSKIDIIKQA